MSWAAGEFVANLIRSGLLSVEEVKVCQQRLAEIGETADAQSLVRELIDQQRLTKYQANMIAQGRTRGLLMGEYAVLDKLGQGGMGMVFRAQHRRMKRIVALKVLPPSVTKSPDKLQRFQREVEAAARLFHPNIVTAFDAGESDGVHYLVMELVEGVDLARHARANHPLPVGATIGFILQAARGLEYAHGQGVIHRDIKPANLLLDRHGTVKILDMGLARLHDVADPQAAVESRVAREGLTQSGAIVGTVGYMAPEQAVDTKLADGRSDIYSLGCTLHFLLAGRPVFTGETMMEALMAHRTEPIPSLCAARPDVPPSIDRLFQRMIAKAPGDRPQSMTELIRELEAILAMLPRGASQSATPEIAAASAGRSMGWLDGPGIGGEVSQARPVSTFQPSEPSARETATNSLRRTDVVRRSPKGSTRRVPLKLLAVGATLACLLGAGAAGLLGLSHMWSTQANAKGTLIVKVDAPGADVVLDGEKVGVTSPQGEEPFTAAVPPGQHQLRVLKDGFVAYTKTLEIEAGQQEVVTASLTPLRALADRDGGEPNRLHGARLRGLDAPVRPVSDPPPGETSPTVGAGKADSRRPGANIPKGTDTSDVQSVSKDRRAIERILERGGEATALLDGREITFRDQAELPERTEKLVLTKASLAGNKSIGNADLRLLAGLEGLETIDLQDTPVDDEGLKELGRLARLRALALRGTKVTDIGLIALAGFNELATLDLEGTAVSDRGLERMEGAQSLRQLRLNGSKVTQAGIRKLERSIPRCAIDSDFPPADRFAAEWALRQGGEIKLLVGDRQTGLISNIGELPAGHFRVVEVDLHGNQDVGDREMEIFEPLTGLKTLWLSDTKLTGPGLGAVKGKQLTGLDLSRCPLNDEGLEQLTELNSLSYLHLGGTKIGDLGMAFVGQIKGLKVLYLTETRITDAGLESLRNLVDLETLQLTGTRVTSAAILKLNKALPMCKIIK